MMLEAGLYVESAFVTLTYSEERLPRSSGSELGTLVPQHMSSWLKRLRKEIAPSRIRFYGVGEYGDETWRPHYHVAVFGLPHCRLARVGARTSRAARAMCRCPVCAVVSRTWGHGRVDVAPLEMGSAAYIAGYVTKKMTMPDDVRLDGRHPEFARMSRRPGIGVGALKRVAEQFEFLDRHKPQTDVPVSLRFADREWPIGRFLRGKLREAVGRVDELPEEVRHQIFAEMYPLLLAARSSSKEGEMTLKGQLRKASQSKLASLKARHQIFNNRSRL